MGHGMEWRSRELSSRYMCPKRGYADGGERRDKTYLMMLPMVNGRGLSYLQTQIIHIPFAISPPRLVR